MITVITLEPGQRLFDGLEIQRGDRLVGDDHHLATMDIRAIEVVVADQVGADEDRVGTIAEIDVESAHQCWTGHIL